MKSLFVDSNSRTVQCSKLGCSLNAGTGIVDQIEPNQFVRIKAVGGDAVIRQKNLVGDGVVISKGETEYFFITDYIEVVSGNVNIMY